MRIGVILGLLLWTGIMIALQGCGPTRGWQVSFGVHPVSETAKTEKLTDKGVK